MELPFAEVQEANEEPNQNNRQKSVGVSKKSSQATDQACEGKCSRTTFSAVFAFQPDEGAGTQRESETRQCETAFVTSGKDIYPLAASFAIG
jgi:hypothetical protein